MKGFAHLKESCGFAALLITGLAIFGAVMVARSIFGGIELFQDEQARAQAHIAAQQALAEAHHTAAWQVWVWAAKELAAISFFLGLAILCLFGPIGFLYTRWRRSRWVWARDGILPLRPGWLAEHPEHAIETVGALHTAEIANARRKLPAAHEHWTIAKGAELPEAPKEEEQHEQPIFHDLYAAGEYANGN